MADLGGENGPRPSHPDWHLAARDFCAAHDIAYFFKQWGSWAPIDDWPSEIVEDFDQEVYGRIPTDVPKVTWEVTGSV